jgi:flavin-dependent dehydrogenase
MSIAQDSSPLSYDVLICGGGLAGLTLARQLRVQLPAVSVAVVERTARPLPEAAHKVGESSVELATHYFGNTLQLKDYFERRHYPKLGLRFFCGDPQGPFDERPELGPSLFPPLPSYQIDRGRLENDLRGILEETGVTLYEGYYVDDVRLSDDEAPHEVQIRHLETGERTTLRGRWLVDALGRRRLLQTKLHLKRELAHKASAAWWRYAGRIDIDDLVPAKNRRWHRRIVESRYFSTNHVMNRGYWVWLIPLGSGNTSIGIVTDETVHPFQSYGGSYETAMGWLADNEPALWDFFQNLEPMDFRGLKNYAYWSSQVFSEKRWSCVGEAGVFLDPFYSPGSDFITFGNTITTEMIRHDLAGRLTPGMVETYNRVFLDVFGSHSLAFYEQTYKTFGHAHIYTAKHLWDVCVYWAMPVHIVFQGLLSDPDPRLFPLGERYRVLNAHVQRLLVDWAEAVPPRKSFEHFDLARVPFVQLMHLDLASRRSADEFFHIARKNLDRLEELAQVLFFQAVREALPERWPEVERAGWVNAWSIGLDPGQWQEAGLFAPDSQPRDLRRMDRSVRGIFEPPSGFASVRLAVRNAAFGAFRGRPAYALYRLLLGAVSRSRLGARARRLFVADRPAMPAPRPGDAAPARQRPETACGGSAETKVAARVSSTGG